MLNANRWVWIEPQPANRTRAPRRPRDEEKVNTTKGTRKSITKTRTNNPAAKTRQKSWLQIAVEEGIADDERDAQRRALLRAELVEVDHTQRHSEDPEELQELALEDAAVTAAEKVAMRHFVDLEAECG